MILYNSDCPTNAKNWVALSGFIHKRIGPQYYNYFDPTNVSEKSQNPQDASGVKKEVAKCMKLCQESDDCAFFLFWTKNSAFFQVIFLFLRTHG